MTHAMRLRFRTLNQ
ncbi:erythromycin resistance leader peptide [Lysinibacillus endophyticus]